MKVKKRRFQGHTLRIDKFFYQKMRYCFRHWPVKKKLIYDVRTILNNYLKKSFLAGALVKNINAQ